MTYLYSEINQADARYNLAREYPGGIEMLAKRLGMSVNVLRNKLAPRITTHHITDEEDSLIIEYSQEAKVADPCRALLAKNYRHGLIAFPMPEVSQLTTADLTQALVRAMKEFSDVTAVSSAALADGQVTESELEQLEKEAQEALAAIVELRERMRESVRTKVQG